MAMDNALFNWSDAYKVGVQEVDEQHQVLVSLLNQLHEAVRGQTEATATRVLLDRLIEYTRTHFLLEESLMRLTHYPAFEKHKQQHEDLIRQVADLQWRLDRGNAAIGIELLVFLRDWLIQHISETDRRFGAFFQTSGFNQYSTWSDEVQTAMHEKKWRWKFW